MQKNDKMALKMGFHKTFFINESRIYEWMKNSNFKVNEFYYQNYSQPGVSKFTNNKGFIICIAKKFN